MNSEGKVVGTVHQIQEEGKSVPEITRGKQAAISVTGPTIGRQINEGDIFYTLLTEVELKTINEKYLSSLSSDDVDLMKEIIETRRKSTPFYGY